MLLIHDCEKLWGLVDETENNVILRKELSVSRIHPTFWRGNNGEPPFSTLLQSCKQVSQAVVAFSPYWTFCHNILWFQLFFENNATSNQRKLAAQIVIISNQALTEFTLLDAKGIHVQGIKSYFKGLEVFLGEPQLAFQANTSLHGHGAMLSPPRCPWRSLFFHWYDGLTGRIDHTIMYK